MRTGLRLSRAAVRWHSQPAPATRRRRLGRFRIPPPEQPVDPPGDGPTDPAEDTRTQAQKDFDDALASARKGLDDARAGVTAAVAAASAAETDDARTQAQNDIRDARDALAAAVSAAKALAELLSDPGRLGERAIFVEEAEATQTEDLVSLLRAEADTGWAGDVAARATPPLVAAVEVDRRLREDENGDDAASLLKAADIPPVMYAPGKTVMGGETLGSSGDRLRMRGMPIIFRAAGGDRHLRYAFSLTSETAHDVVADLAAVRNNRPALFAGLTINPGGLVVDMGGKNATGMDFRALSYIVNWPNSLRFHSSLNPNPPNGYDLRLGFGRPAASPEGNAEHYWEAALIPTPDLVTAATAAGFLLRDGDRDLPVGVYQMRLSNHIGFDSNQEDPDADEPYTADDENHYMTYAAYGFMDFLRPGVTASYATNEHGLQRIFPFHVGYDAFKDQAGMRTTNIGEAAITGGTFKGRTMAVQFRIDGGAGNDLVSLANAKRMRGDIELTATISGTAASNTITGTISNMEDWDSKGYWENSAIMPNDIEFHASNGVIDAKGEFTGTFANYPAGYAKGGYRGRFYGPHDDLEAAGAWAMSPASGQVHAIAGSFGAAIVREDGTYGRVVQGTEVSASD